MMLPSWGLGVEGAALAVARSCWLAGLLSTAGALAYRALEPSMPAAIGGRLTRLAVASLGVALLGWLAWVLLQTASMAGSTALVATLHAVPSVLADSAFGRLAMVQVGSLALAALTLRWLRWPSALLAMAAVAAQVGHLHAWAMEHGPGPLTVAALLHLLGAAVWLGGLLPLLIVVRRSAPAHAAAASRRFSRRAIPCVVLIALSAGVQGWDLLGGMAGLAGTAYGWTASAKTLLFAAMLGFAAYHRSWLTPALASPEPQAAHRTLVRSIARETVVGGLVILAAALLSGLQPGMHSQPVWPFPLQPSLATVSEDPGFMREVVVAGAALLAASALLGAAVWRGRWRWPALGIVAIVAWLATPHLRLLLVPAYPTSFYRSPAGFAATSIVEGEALYAANCASCHGAQGHGDGPAAAGMPLPPADLTAAHLWMHPDGELFWWLSHGIDAPAGGLAMPGFAATLDEDARWNLIDFIRAHNAGLYRAGTGAWPLALRAPDLTADCAGSRSVTLAELRGKPVRLTFPAAAVALPVTVPPGTIAATEIVVPSPDAAEAGGGDCIASDPSVLAAYSVVTGLSPAALAGTEVLVDANGWLRDVVRDPAPDKLGAALRRLAAPLPAQDDMAAMMHPG